MQIKVMRHYGGADDADGDIERFFAMQHGYKARGDVVKRRFGEDDLDKEGASYHGDQADHEGFHAAHAHALKKQKEKGVEHGDAHAVDEGQTGKQLQTDGHAENFGEIAGGDGDLGQYIKRDIDIRRIDFSVGLGQITAANDTETGGEVLQQDSDGIAHKQYPDERVAKTAAAGEIGGPVSRVHIADAYEIGRTEKNEKLTPPRPFTGGVDAAVYFTQANVFLGANVFLK